MTNGATNIKKGVAEFHKLLPRCKDHPALVDEGAKAEALWLTLLVVELVVVEVMSVDVGEDADDDEVPETAEVIAKMGLMSPVSPYTRFQTRVL